MFKLIRLFPILLKYLVQVGPLLYKAINLGVKVSRSIRHKKEHKTPATPEVAPVKRIDPG
jgi:hypothetical protein